MKITSINVRHFKAVENSGTIKLGALTALVGYNGTGKSSVIEACEFFQTYALGGIEAALAPWFNQAATPVIPIIDEIDAVLAGHYGFTAVELDFILNYDIKYRLGPGR